MKRLLLALALTVSAIAPASAGTLADVRARGMLNCGVNEGLRGFALKGEDGAWRGFDIDFCRALATVVLGDPDKVTYLPLSARDRFAALSEGKIDVLSRNSTWTMSRDVAQGLSFAGTSYYDGQAFMVPALFGMTSALGLEGATICLVGGTTTEANAAAYFAAAGVNVTFKEFAERGAARAAYETGDCDAYTADRSALAAERSLLKAPDDHVILGDVVSKEPLGPVTRDDDIAWTDLVRWALYGLITAEEIGLDMAGVGGRGAEAAALGAAGAKAFGLSPDWVAQMVASVGNYGEIFARNLGEETPLALKRGLNAQWTQGGLIYAPPMQ